MTRTHATTEVRTIQCWPKGTTYTYRGDPDGPINSRSLRFPSRNGQPATPWRKGLDHEWREIRIEVRAEKYLDREILHFDSPLVEALSVTRALMDAFTYDEIGNVEIAEWYRVTTWLRDELSAIGEVTIGNEYGCWWGRQTTGQMLIIDGVLQKVAARHEREGAL